MKLRYKIGAGGIILGFVFLIGRCSKNKPISTTPEKNGSEKIVINPHKHTITIPKPEGPEEIFLPENPSTIEVDPKGHVIVTADQYGTELYPFGGVGYSASSSIILGLDLVYWKRWDGGLAFVVPMNTGWAQETQFAAAISYTAYDNLRLTGSVSATGRIGLFATVRF